MGTWVEGFSGCYGIRLAAGAGFSIAGLVDNFNPPRSLISSGRDRISGHSFSVPSVMSHLLWQRIDSRSEMVYSGRV